MEEKIHYGRRERTKCGIEKASWRRFGTNFGYAITDKINEVTCLKCLAGLKKKGEV
jgi:hypothetical protein